MGYDFRETGVSNRADLEELLQQTFEKNHLGTYTVDDVATKIKEVLDKYGEFGLNSVVYKQLRGPEHRGALTFQTLHAETPLSPDAQHGASCAFYADLHVNYPGAKEPIALRATFIHERGPKPKNFDQVYNDPEKLDDAIARGLIKPGTLGLIGGSVDGGEMTPMQALYREIAEEMAPERAKEGDLSLTDQDIEKIVSEFLPIGAKYLEQKTAALDTYQKPGKGENRKDGLLLALGYAVDVSSTLEAHLKKMDAVAENNRAYLANEKSREDWLKSGALETLDYRLYSVGGIPNTASKASELIVKALYDDRTHREKHALELRDNAREFEEKGDTKAAQKSREMADQASMGTFHLERMLSFKDREYPGPFNSEEIDRMKKIYQYFVSRPDGKTFTYAHENILMHAVEQEGWNIARSQAFEYGVDIESVNTKKLNRDEVSNYIVNSILDLYRDGALKFDAQGAIIDLTDKHLNEMVARRESQKQTFSTAFQWDTPPSIAPSIAQERLGRLTEEGNKGAALKRVGSM